MPLFNLYSYRKRVAEGDVPDVFTYDELPETLRNQIVWIWRDAIGPADVFDSLIYHNTQKWEEIHDAVAREHGVSKLGNGLSPFDRCIAYLHNSPVDKALDLIEFSFFYVDKVVRNYPDHVRMERGIIETAANSIDELNERFRRAGVGYQFEYGEMFRVDSELIHSEVVRPALRYLHQRGFKGPRDEFLEAHRHYRAGDAEDAIVDANKAFESTLKVICKERGWQHSQGTRASDLLKVVRENGLLPDYLDNSFDQLVATLKTGLPKVRNAAGAHGRGAERRETPDYIGAYALHLAAAKILFLAEAHEATK